jgi:hypothetical protein
VTNTCVNTGVSGSSIVLLCQTFMSAGVGAGDSGSDVFQILSGLLLTDREPLQSETTPFTIR